MKGKAAVCLDEGEDERRNGGWMGEEVEGGRIGVRRMRKEEGEKRREGECRKGKRIVRATELAVPESSLHEG